MSETWSCLALDPVQRSIKPSRSVVKPGLGLTHLSSVWVPQSVCALYGRCPLSTFFSCVDSSGGTAHINQCQQTLFHLFYLLRFEHFSHHFAGVCFRVTQSDVTVEVHLIVIPDELEDSDMEATGEGHAVLCHADGVVLNVWTPREEQILYL